MEVYESQIQYLRDENRRLVDRIIAMSNVPALEAVSYSEQVNEPEGIDLMGVLDSMEPRNEAEVEQKKQAQDQVNHIMGLNLG